MAPTWSACRGARACAPTCQTTGRNASERSWALALAAAGSRVVVVSSGDPGVFAMASVVFEVMDEHPQWQRVAVQVLPGVTAMLAAAARVGAPLGHDFCVVNLSDNLKPWPLIERRVLAAVDTDMALALYNPRSNARPDGFGRVLDLLQHRCEPARWVVLARAVTTPQDPCGCCCCPGQRDMVDMRTLVIVGSSRTKRVGPFVYTPRQVTTA
jgi:precorrin-3B C17-methyltransferase